jgi:hypothetical protein
MKLWHDWEFLEEQNSIYPISVGMVTEDGEELYYEFIQAPMGKIYRHEWLKENVLPALSSGHNAALVSGEGNNIVKSTLAIRLKVYDFLEAAFDRAEGNLELWGWYSAYDHVCLGQLFGAMVNLPAFVPYYTNDLKQEVNRLGNPRIPNLRNSDEVLHNALDDARVEKRMGDWLRSYELGLGRNVNVSNSSRVQIGHGNTQVNHF